MTLAALVAADRGRFGLDVDELARRLGLSALESGTSAAERWLPLLLGVAQELDQPIFNFFYPFGVPLRELDAYA